MNRRGGYIPHTGQVNCKICLNQLVCMSSLVGSRFVLVRRQVTILINASTLMVCLGSKDLGHKATWLSLWFQPPEPQAKSRGLMIWAALSHEAFTYLFGRNNFIIHLLSANKNSFVDLWKSKVKWDKTKISTMISMLTFWLCFYCSWDFRFIPLDPWFLKAKQGFGQGFPN